MDRSDRVAAEVKQRSIPAYWIIGLFVFVNTMICYFDRVNFSVAAPTIMNRFHWDMGILGVAMSMFGVGYILTQIPAGLLSDRFGGRKVLAAGSVGWSFCTLLTPFAGTPLLMYLVRGLLGLAEGLNFPGATSVLSRWVPRKARARIQGLNLSGVAAGPLIATPLTIWIMTAFGWKAMFYFYGVLGLVWAGAWLLYSTEHPFEHKGMSRENLREIETGQASEEAVSVGDAPVRSKAVWGLAIAYFCFTYTWWLFLNWLPTYLVQARGYTTIKMGSFASLPWLAALISTNGAGWLSDLLVKRGFSTGGARRTLIYAGAPAMAVCLWFVTQAGNAGVAVALISVTISLAGMNFPGFWSLPMDMNVRKAGFITGMMNTGSALASIVAPGVTGYVAMWFGWTTALGLGSVLALLSAIVMYLTAPKLERRLKV
ncbi:MAG TPA: MFS transporter [Thermodesulfobacteriota bacterium]|nr:MFS transporter [Thermodesulfobacteriota bacterium]